MWMVDPELLCREHLLGEHNELHKIYGCLKIGRSLKGYFDKGFIELQSLEKRHKELVDEMLRRKYNHNSPLQFECKHKFGKVDVKKNIEELRRRCERCLG